MRLKLFACKVLYREISFLSYNSPHILDVTWLRQGFHDTPELLRKLLQDSIDAVDEGRDPCSYKNNETQDSQFDAILLGYGLCCNAIVGVVSRRHPLVIPRGHDCITLLLGSKEEYKRQQDFMRNRGFWYSGGWLENCLMPGKERTDTLRERYRQKFGPKKADFLLDMEQSWINDYDYAAFIDWPELKNADNIRYAQKCANELGWQMRLIPGSSFLLYDFVNGNWRDEDFLVVPPGQQVAPSYDPSVICLDRCG
ncbi:MAG: DUF1638 domain-containing protein [Gracilibacteraceae bacterium]|jgi:hypothetical protein|nr:DUF1638 domain-containing protein [Gracilibacteraceae bacterium]